MSNSVFKIITVSVLALALSGCSRAFEAADSLNPFAEDVPQGFGERNNRAILEEGAGGNDAKHARHALETMREYRAAQPPKPYYPVVRPAEVRLMWVPDHLNKYGDLIPAHYYYLKVRNDQFELQDAFEVEEQLHSGNSSSTGPGSATPWVYKGVESGRSRGQRRR